MLPSRCVVAIEHLTPRTVANYVHLHYRFIFPTSWVSCSLRVVSDDDSTCMNCIVLSVSLEIVIADVLEILGVCCGNS